MSCVVPLAEVFGPEILYASLFSYQDPSYPVYVDTSVMMGQTGEVNEESMQYENIVYMPCNPTNNFFPDLKVQISSVESPYWNLRPFG